MTGDEKPNWSPFDRPLRRLDVAGLRSVDRGDHAELVGVEVLVAVRDDDGVAGDGDAGVDRALRGDVAPDLLAGLRLHRVDAAVAAAADEQPRAVDRGDHRRRVVRVVRPAAGAGDPDDVAGPLVERDEAVLPRRARAPARDRRADDHQVAVDERRHRPAAVRGEGGELLADRAIPQELAVLAQRDDRRADAQRVDVAGLGIGGGRGPAHAVRGDVALEDVELVFPDDLAGVGVERHDALLQRLAGAGRVLHVDAVAHDDRSGAAAVRGAPQEVLAVQRPLLDQALFVRGPVAMRTARFRPVSQRHAPGTLCGSEHSERPDERREQEQSFEHGLHSFTPSYRRAFRLPPQRKHGFGASGVRRKAEGTSGGTGGERRRGLCRMSVA